MADDGGQSFSVSSSVSQGPPLVPPGLDIRRHLSCSTLKILGQAGPSAGDAWRLRGAILL